MVDEVLREFYRTDLRKGEVIVDNSDSKIAEVLGLNKQKVCGIITNHLNYKYKNLSEPKNENLNKSNHYVAYILLEKNKQLRNKIKDKDLIIKNLKESLIKNNTINKNINDACIMFENGYKTIEVYKALKYNTRSVFYRQFKKVKGISVTEFKKKLNETT